MEKPFAAYTGDQPFVFVCYAHEDSDVVYPEMAWLRDQSVNLWYDEGIPAGENWRAAIGESLLGASQVLFYISKRSLKSDHCNREINLALDEGKDVVPVYIEEVELTTDLKVGLNRVQALHREEDESYQRHLLHALGQAVEVVSPSIPPKSASHQRLGATIVAVLAILIGAGWWYWQSPSSLDRSEGKSTPTIAVLPFDNIGITEDYFSKGVAEEILNRMIRFANVRVISRHSSFAFRESELNISEIGEHLGANYILQGSVQRDAGMVRIAVYLTNTATGTEIWANSYDRELADMLRVQAEIAQLAVGELLPNIAITPSIQPAVDPIAYELYLKARGAIAANDPISAKSLLQSAITLANEFSDAYAALADVHESLRIYGFPTFVGNDELQRVLGRALELDPNNPEALAVEALLDFYVHFDVAKSVSKFERLLKESSSTRVIHHYRPLLIAMGKFEDLLLIAKRRRELDPHSSITALTEFWAYMGLGEFNLAREAANRLPLEPVSGSGWSGRRPWLIHIDLATDQLESAETNLNFLGPDFHKEGRLYFQLWLAIERGDLDAARDLYAAQPISISALPLMTWLPFDAVLTGDISRTLDEIERPTESRSIVWITQLRFRDRWTSEHVAPAFGNVFESLRSDPRYGRALENYGIDDASLAQIQVHTADLWK